MATKNNTNYIYETVEYTVHSEKEETTNLNTIKWTFDWTVRNFLQLLGNKNISGVRTKKPTEIPPGEIKFQLKIHFLGRKRDLIEIYCLSPTPVVLNLALTCLSNVNREMEFTAQSVATEKDSYTVDAYKWYYLTTLFKKRDENIVDYDTNKLSLLRDGGLYLRFKFTVTNNPEVNQSNVALTQLTSDFESLLNESTFSDVVIKSVDDEEFKAHKAVLGSRCEVLKAHFQHTTEAVTNMVESPFESEVLREIIFFIYTDKVPKIDEIPEKLLAAADYYQLTRIKSLCENALIKKLTIENAIETLELADLYSATTLKQMTLDFIRDEDGPELKMITKTESWAKVQSGDLIKIICEHIAAEDTNEDAKIISN